uniref:Uncharacterized protein n=1 Tax=viral metagenome TaxID=1070528 RepID=A0A6M3K3I9_9ZZZZ
MDRNLTRYYNQAPMIKRRVWFPGTTAIRKGMGLCYDLDVAGSDTGQAATDGWGRRGNSVAVPSSTNNLAFAGVASQYYSAKSNGQMIDIYEPGGLAEIAIGRASTIFSNSAGTLHTCSVNSADAGRFTLQGLSGRGTAIALQTLARADGGDIAFSSVDGSATSSWSSPSLTISKTGIGTACGNGDSTIDPTEFRVVILGGATTADSTTAVATKGEYAVVTAPTADTVTIATNIGTSCSVTLYVIKTSYPTILAYLMDGEESGLQEVLTPKSAAAIQSMVGGTTFLCGGLTMATDSTATLADGIIEGQKKAFCCMGTLTTQDYLITVTSGLKAAGTALATLELDAAGEFGVLVWHGNLGGQTAGLWRVLTFNGTEA